MSDKPSELTKQESIRKIRAPIQIYRPPGLRTGTTNQSTLDSTKLANTVKPVSRKESDQLSNASSESQNSVKKNDRPPKAKESRAPAKKVVARDEIVALVQKLNLPNEQSMIDDFIGSMESNETASRLGHFVSRYAIEENKQHQRICSQLCTLLLDCSAGQAFYNGLTASLRQYFDCGEKLRTTHFRIWQNFLNFLSDLYSHVGYRFENELATIIFNTYTTLLSPPILHELKIEELECLIGILLNLGYDLERDCPVELSSMKGLIRDACLLSNETWARKMILLSVELSASNYVLSAEANDFYFN